MKYIDAEKLIALIDAKLEDLGLSGSVWVGRSVLQELKNDIITSLQQEQPEMDEDFFFDEVLKVYDDNNKYPPRSEEELTMLETIARHFWNKGYNARNEK